MNLKPENISSLQALLRKASKPLDDINLSAINNLIEHSPEDMTVTVQAGMTLVNLQNQLAQNNQWLPIDPPFPEQLTVGNLLAENVNGPRRFSYGTIRDWIIGMKVVLPDGRLIKSGGKVVKNVAGFDLCKLFVGDRSTLGIIVQATFKLLPIPESEIILGCECQSLDEINQLLENTWNSDLRPSILDIHNPPLTLVAGFAGPKTDVEAQTLTANRLGFASKTTTDYDQNFRKNITTYTSVAPANLIKKLRSLENDAFVARAGNGVIYHKNAVARDMQAPALQQRLRNAFDPKGILSR